MATRIESKSRPTKRPIMEGTGSGDSFVRTAGKPHRFDPRGYTIFEGVPAPVIAAVGEASAPEPEPEPEPEGEGSL